MTRIDSFFSEQAQHLYTDKFNLTSQIKGSVITVTVKLRVKLDPKSLNSNNQPADMAEYEHPLCFMT